MCLGKDSGIRGLCVVPIEESGSLGKVGSMRRRFRYRGVLVFKSAWINGGTVEPPCDFQKGFMELPVNRGVPP